MSQFVVSARKYRPATFESVVGQASVTNTLKNAISNNHLAQAFLFCGPRGVGKTTCARILAKAVNAENLENLDKIEDDPLNIFELDAASNNSVEDIRNLIDQVRIAPQAGKEFKVYIIDEVHMLSQAAFNAFLKTLEEPPSYAIFILATTEKHKILPTILSRCQIFDFNRIQIKDIADHLLSIAKKEAIEAEPDALHLIAQKADGALRDALSIFDQIVSFSGKKLTYANVIENLNILDYDYYFKISDAIEEKQIPQALMIFDEILQKGFDGHNFVNGLAEHFRNLLVCQDAATLSLLEVGENIRERYREQSLQWTLPSLLAGLEILARCDVQYKVSKNQRLLVEIGLMELCSMDATTEKKKSGHQPIIKSQSAGDPPPKPAEAVSVPTQPAITPPKAEKKHEVPPIAPEPKLPPIPPSPSVYEGGNYKSGEISIQGMIQKHRPKQAPEEEKKEEKKENKAENTGKVENFSLELLQKEWLNFAELQEKEGRMGLAAILKTRKPEIDENFKLKLVITNQVEEMDLNSGRTELLEYLRKALNNNAIQLEHRIEEVELERKLYGDKEKFERMAEINPNLKKLKQKFDLDI